MDITPSGVLGLTVFQTIVERFLPINTEDKNSSGKLEFP
jgi:antitoxin component of RelBE/YafQ-DinJ toxin-antitoxin module